MNQSCVGEINSVDIFLISCSLLWTDHPDKLVAVTVERRRSSEQTRQIGLLSNQLGNLGTPGDTGPLGEYGIMILLPGERSQ